MAEQDVQECAEHGARHDGVRGMVAESRMAPSARKLRDNYARKPGAPFFQREFGFYCLERWKEQGISLPQDAPDFKLLNPDEQQFVFDRKMEKLFGYDPRGNHELHGLGWGEAEFSPAFEDRVIEDRGDHELVQDVAGRHVLFFKGRRSGFMPEYLAHPVKDRKTWEESCKWRLDASTPARYSDLAVRMGKAREAASKGLIITQRVQGGYMYLRSLIGSVDLLYMVHDAPDLIHDCMRTWLALADAVTARHQEYVTFDEMYLGEDVCFNHGPLISPEMIREFLLPYYQQLIANIKSRQLDRSRHLYFHLDTDGFVAPVIPLYRELGMDVTSPVEVASGCDVVEIGRQFPEMALFGGIDKRVLAKGKREIDALLDRVLPVMHKRGGYIPTCDHGVPEEVTYEDYLHYRKRCLEYAV